MRIRGAVGGEKKFFNTPCHPNGCMLQCGLLSGGTVPAWRDFHEYTNKGNNNMKKLLTMIAAVATAFGLYAADEKDGTSFEGS